MLLVAAGAAWNANIARRDSELGISHVLQKMINDGVELFLFDLVLVFFFLVFKRLFALFSAQAASEQQGVVGHYLVSCALAVFSSQAATVGGASRAGDGKCSCATLLNLTTINR